METSLPLEPALRVALAWQPHPWRESLQALFELDARLARVVARAREPMLAQIRFAWWRERLEQPAAGHPMGEPLLARISAGWGDRAALLIPLVDSWDERLGDSPLSPEALARFARGRGEALAGLAELAGAPGHRDSAALAGERWAFADLAGRRGEREAVLAAGTLPASLRLPRALRGIAVLDRLAARAIERGEPMLAGRKDALVALRLGLLGR